MKFLRTVLAAAIALLVTFNLSALAGTAQTITFPEIENQISTGGPITLGATASSGLTVTYSVVGGASVATESGGTLTLTGTAGSVTVCASQSGDGTYDAATNVYRSFVVGTATERFVKIAAAKNGSFSAGIRANGTLWTWGYGNQGQLGNGGTSTSQPVQVGTATNWSTVACGTNHGIAVRTDNTLWAWGVNTTGQLGIGSTTSKTTPVQIGTDTNWTTVACGANHTVALRSDKTLWAWGDNTYGQLGTGDTTQQISPVQIGTDTNWSAVACGDSFTVALRDDGTLWAWGRNNYSQLGNGNTTQQNSPVQIGTATTWASVACGANHCVAVRTDGTLWTWGLNNVGQLGFNPDVTSPTQVGSATTWVSADGGGNHTVAIQSDGTIWGWGSNAEGQTGIMISTILRAPQQIGTATTWTAVACGSAHSIALHTNGTLAGFGRNMEGQLGDGAVTKQYSTVLTDNSTAWSSVSSGVGHNLGIRSNGTLWAWGSNGFASLGNSFLAQANAPTQIGTNTSWVAAASGAYHSMARRSDGTLWAWGANYYGELGLGTGYYENAPVQVGTATNWASVSCGTYFTVGLRTDGTLWAWGLNSSGQVGDGTNTNRLSPVQVGSETTWTAVECGGGHTLALRSDGTLWAWGLNDNGQLGIGNTTSQNSPVQIGSATNWVSIACGARHSLAIRSDGTLWTWGENYYSQLGNGNTTQQTSPVQIGTATNWASVAGGENCSLAVRSDNTLWAWGWNELGQLGTGDNTNQSSPVQIGTAQAWSSLPKRLGRWRAAAIALDGSLWSTGNSSNGQLGRVDLPNAGWIWPSPNNQTLSWSALPATVNYGQQLALSATATSGRTVTYYVSGPATRSGTTLTTTGTGTVTVMAYAAADTAWLSTAPTVQSFQVVAIPPTVTTPASSNLTSTTATLGGTVTSDGGATVTERGFVYSLTSQNSNPTIGTATKVTVSGTTGSFSVNLTGLEKHGDYSFKAYATNSAGTTYTNAATFTLPLTAPGAPTIGTAVAGNASATVSFTAPTEDGGTAVTGYTVTSNPDGITATGTASPISISGLTNGVSYTFTVTATNSVGTGSSSTASNAVIPSEELTLPATSIDAVPGAGVTGSGVPAGATWRSFGIPGFDCGRGDGGVPVFLANFDSPNTNPNILSAIYGLGGSKPLIAKTGDRAPDTETASFVKFSDPVGNNGTAFIATTRDNLFNRSNNPMGLWSNAFPDAAGTLHAVARQGYPAADLNRPYTSIQSFALNDGQNLFWTATLAGANESNFALFLQSSLADGPHVILQEGDTIEALPGVRVKSFVALKEGGTGGLPGVTAAIGTGRANGGATTPVLVTLNDGSVAVVKAGLNSLQVIARTRTEAPGISNARFKTLGLPAAAGSTLAFRAVLAPAPNTTDITKKNETAIYAQSDSYSLSVVAQEGDDIGNGKHVFCAFGDPVANSNGDLVFYAQIQACTCEAKRVALFVAHYNGSEFELTRLATLGDEAPGLEGVIMAKFGGAALPQVFDADVTQYPVFIAKLKTGLTIVKPGEDTALFAYDTNGNATLLVRTGLQTNGKTLKTIGALSAVAASPAQARTAASSSKIIYRATYTDGTQAIVEVPMP